MQTLEWAIRHAASMYGSEEAVVDGATRLSFAQLGERCVRLGAALLALGIRQGDRIAVLMDNSHRYLELHCAIPGIGAVIVPINSRLAPAEMAYVLADSGATVFVVDERHTETAARLAGRGIRLLRAPDEYESLVSAASPTPLPGPASAADLAGLYYTSGTTGAGKGVMLSHANLVAANLQLAIAFQMRREFVVLNVFPLFHLAAIAGMYALIWLGVKQVFVPTADVGLILETIQRERITHASIVPTLLNVLLADARSANADLSSLQQLTHGGSPIAPDLCVRAFDRLKCRLVQGYGMTETAGVGTLLHDEHLLLNHERITSAGRVVAGMELVVRRPDGRPCKPREVGEVTLRGPNVMSGYWQKLEQTAQVLRAGWLWTGDLAFLDEQNYVFIVDRTKDMIVSGGENVYSAEVEAALASRPEVLEVAVIGVPSQKWGEEVHAVVRLRPGSVPGADELIAHCRGRIAPYKCPKAVTFVSEELPKSAVGKILKREVRARFWTGHQRGVA